MLAISCPTILLFTLTKNQEFGLLSYLPLLATSFSLIYTSLTLKEIKKDRNFKEFYNTIRNYDVLKKIYKPQLKEDKFNFFYNL